MRGAIVLAMAFFLGPTPMTEMVCEGYTYIDPDTIVCHGADGDTTLDYAFLGYDEDPDHPGDYYLFVAGYPR